MEEYKLAKANTVTVLDNKQNNHYKLVKSIQDIFDCEDQDMIDDYIADNTHPDNY